jgi:hypothetical protein
MRNRYYRQSRLVAVTPAQAKEWRNTSTQAVQEHKVERLLQQIEAGKWDAGWHADQPIKLSADGTLQNGNHRLEAISRQHSTVKCWVWRNPDGNHQP